MEIALLGLAAGARGHNQRPPGAAMPRRSLVDCVLLRASEEQAAEAESLLVVARIQSGTAVSASSSARTALRGWMKHFILGSG